MLLHVISVFLGSNAPSLYVADHLPALKPSRSLLPVTKDSLASAMLSVKFLSLKLYFWGSKCHAKGKNAPII
jgi:hypothetical protein